MASLSAIPVSESLTEIPPKEQWFRIPERETENFKLDRVYQENYPVRHTRSIARAGYYLMPTDMDGELATSRAIEIMTDWRDKPSLRPKNYDANYPVGMFKMALYQARKQWHEKQVLELRKERNDLNLRTFWYYDHPERFSFIERRVVRKVGRYYPAWSSNSWSGYDDYDPAGIDVTSTTTLAKVIGILSVSVLVHPKDILSS